MDCLLQGPEMMFLGAECGKTHSVLKRKEGEAGQLLVGLKMLESTKQPVLKA